MSKNRRSQTRDDVYAKPSFLPSTLYTECRAPERSMQALMGLHDNRDKMRQCVETMSACATRHLDPTKGYAKQPKHTLQRYLRSVSRHVDIMDAYEDAWPALAYARIWLKWSQKARSRVARRGDNPAPRGTSSQKNRGTSTQQTDHSQPKPTPDKENKMPPSQASIPEDAPQDSSQTMRTTPSQTHVPATQTSTRMRSRTLCSRDFQRTPPPNQRQLSPRPPRQRQPNASTSGISSTRAHDSSASSVGTFLHSLAQPLDHLLPVLYEVGVRDAGNLIGLAQLRNRGDWLYVLVVDRKITSLEYKLIADGLDDLIEAKQG